MYAIVETGGKQYRVSSGQVLKVEKIETEKGASINLDKVLLISRDDDILTGTPYIDGATVRASVIETEKDKKVLVFKKKPRKGFKSLRGHRQYYTTLKIGEIEAGG